MSQEITKRVVTLSISLIEALQALKLPKKWMASGEYLDADAYDDVYHTGYTASDIIGAPVPGAAELFPDQVAMALEYAEREAWAVEIGDARRNAIKKAFEMISGIQCEYIGIDSNGSNQSVSIEAGIESVELDVPAALVTLTIRNPEHLINNLINGLGRFYPHEITVDQVLSPAELKRYFLATIGDFFDVYGVALPSGEIDSNFVPNIDTETFKIEFEYRVSELPEAEIAEAIIEATETEKVTDYNEALSIAAKLTNIEESKLREAVRKVAGEKIKATEESLKKFT